jgi:hypothetical protein
MWKIIRPAIERFLLSPAYFILFSIYPVFWMYAHNVFSVLLAELFRPLLISLIIALLFFWLLQKVTHHSHTSALIVFVVFMAFFYYGHARNLMYAFQGVIWDEILAGIWLLLVVLASMWIGRSARNWDMKTIAVTLNLLMVILLLYPAILVLVYFNLRAKPLERKTDHTVKVVAASTSPDIYYIILDAYTRSDVMKDKVGYDNQEFLKSLKDMGFYVAGCSQSNYGSTSLSLSSSLNMDYLQNISNVYQPGEKNLVYTFKGLDSNALRNTLTDAGYQTVAFASGFNWIEWRDANHFISPSEYGVTAFETMVSYSTFARVMNDFGVVYFNDLFAEDYRERTRLVLNSFDDVLKLPSPKFVFIHIIAPHPPFGLDSNGNNINPDSIDPMTGYENQAKFISKAIVPQLQKLINGSANPPVIILQGDHGRIGSPPKEIMTILNAYYLPGHADQLYPSITPVNSFRVVLNSYFGTNFPLLKDISYYSSPPYNYDFAVVPNTCH